jgi:ribosomal protein L3
MTEYTTSGRDFQGEFRRHLVAGGKSPHTTEAYARDVGLFGEWLERTNGKVLALVSSFGR